ncbi:MAG: hypothetical protein LBG97_03305 [Coriobacteriales bacterium]|nr:hypothetical protein [Coriobacteriales bacterium]
MKTAGQNGGFYDQNIISKHAGSDSLIPLKSDDTRFADTGSYGGYRTLTNSHFVLLRFADRHGKECRKIVPVPLLYKDSNKALHAYLAQNSAANYELLCEIPFKSLLKVDGYPVYVDGSSSGLLVSNAKQLALDVDKTVVLKNGLKLLEKRKKDKNYTVTPYDGVDEDSNLVLFRHFVGCMLGGYAKRPSIDAPLAVISTPNAEQCFAKMSIPEQIEVLVDISRLFRRVASSSSCVDLRPFGDARSMSGSTSVPLALNSSKTYKLIRQSVTGLLEKELDLWELSGDSKPDATRSYTQPVLSDVGSAVVTTASATANAVSGTAYDDTAANTAANKTADVVA